MSAEIPTQQAKAPRTLVSSNRRQVVLFAVLTLILTIATVWGGRVWLKHYETLVFAVGDANGPEARFAAKLAIVLKNNASRLRLKIVTWAPMALAIFAPVLPRPPKPTMPTLLPGATFARRRAE